MAKTQPTLALTFSEMCIRVAEYLGVAKYSGGAALIPTDAHDLDLCKRLVNDGYRKFFTAQPEWNWLQPIHAITFDPDGSGSQCVDSTEWRYYMPEGFYGITTGKISYQEAKGQAGIEWTTEAEIRRNYATAGDITGDPTLAAVRPIQVDDNLVGGEDIPLWELIVYPKPGSADVITLTCKIFPNKMVVTSAENPNCGIAHHETVLAAALACAELHRDGAAGPKADEYDQSLIRSIAIDRRRAPQKLGYCGDGSDHRRSWFTGVDGYYDVDDNLVQAFTL